MRSGAERSLPTRLLRAGIHGLDPEGEWAGAAGVPGLQAPVLLQDAAHHQGSMMLNRKKVIILISFERYS